MGQLTSLWRGLGPLAAAALGLLTLTPANAQPDPSPPKRTAERDSAAPLVVLLDSQHERLPEGALLSVARQLAPPLGGPQPTDPDAVRWLIAGAKSELPGAVRLASFSRAGRLLDERRRLPLLDTDCPASLPASAGDGNSCGRTPLMRLYADPNDSKHPTIKGHVLLAELGGRVTVFIGERAVHSRSVGAPRQLGVSGVLEARLRPVVVRSFSAGPPSIGSRAHPPAALLAHEIERANWRWAQCGIRFVVAQDRVDTPSGETATDDPQAVAIVDPPPRNLLTVGCEWGLPAGGGQVTFAVDDRRFEFTTVAGQTPRQLAWQIRERLEGAGYAVTLSSNAPLSSGANASLDLRVTDPNGRATVLGDVGAPLSTDPTLAVCLPEVDFARGLPHFGDGSSSTGTPEERALLRAVMDDDPRTIDVVVIPWFTETGRVGESFIETHGSGFQNVVILDRVGLRAGPRSSVLAHELGHVLMKVGGHPDDFAVDTPWSLMDSDAADDSVFGPRRLSLEECRQAIVESGPGSPVPLLEMVEDARPAGDAQFPRRSQPRSAPRE